MSIKNKIIATILGLSLVVMVVPAGASAALTSTQVSAIISLLQSFGADAATIANVQASLTGGTPTTPTTPSTGACAGVSFTRNLTVGSTGTDVTCLQTMLNVSPKSGYFGPVTLAAVKAYQAAQGLTPANQVGPLTRAKLNASIGGVVTPVTPITPGTGTEGSITVTKSVSPISGVEMGTGASNVAVIAADVKATGSDVTVNRVDLLFDTAVSGSSACNIRPWTNISGLTVSDGTTSKTVAVTQSSVTETTVGSSYTVRAEGLSFLVPMGTTKKLTVSVNAVSALPSGATTCTSGIEFAANAVRGTDTLGVSQYGPSSALTAVNSFTVKTGDTGTLTVSANSDNPKAKNVIVSETGSTDVTLLKFNVEAKQNDVIVRKIYVQPYSSSTTLATTMPTLKLLDGTTEVASTSTAASATFDVTAITIAKGTTKTFTVVGTLAKTNASAVSEGDNVFVNMAAADVSGEDASTFATVTGTGATLTGEKQYAYLKAPVFAYVSSSVTPVTPTSGSTTQSANFELKFNLTAVGGDIYVRKYDATAASSGIVATSTSGQAAGSSTITYSLDSTATSETYSWKVGAGETKQFTITANSVSENYSASFFEGIGALNVKWGTASGDEDGSAVQTWGIDDLKTGQLLLNARL